MARRQRDRRAQALAVPVAEKPKVPDSASAWEACDLKVPQSEDGQGVPDSAHPSGAVHPAQTGNRGGVFEAGVLLGNPHPVAAGDRSG